MADIKWIKLTTDMFDNRKIKHLRRLPEGNSIVLIWVMLLTMAGRCNSGGMIFLTENIPYTPKMLADELDFEENTVQLALNALEQLNMIVTNNGFFAISGWDEYQNIEGMDKIREQNRLRKQKQREKQKSLPDVSRDSHGTVTQSHATDKEEDKDKDKKEKKNNKTYSDDPELNQAILAFMEYRKSVKKPMTDHAVKLLLSKLNGMTTYIPEQIEILNQSIVNGWQGIFPLKDNQPVRQGGYQKQTKAEELSQFYEMCATWSES
ncbi:MAG: phage replisome organizer N-terminal domain-containing protein [Bacteroidaceae bacterium]|nr:phage replisome organizer N-terminal domain-containing protein [Bacteroidaceae bacterium]